MLKNISNLEGAQKLTKNEQKVINGGAPRPCPVCPDGTVLVAPYLYGTPAQCTLYCAM